MKDIYCPFCGGNLSLDIAETRKNELRAVYSCQCGKLFILECIGSKEAGFRTKEMIANKTNKEVIPF